ncbi:MAG: hypothetical protein M1820_003491 [Bogoriella megaspora]|nr:MAG: hypothetical protein M1820_003491 [Bogoriella megaspora]
MTNDCIETVCVPWQPTTAVVRNGILETDGNEVPTLRAAVSLASNCIRRQQQRPSSAARLSGNDPFDKPAKTDRDVRPSVNDTGTARGCNPPYQTVLSAVTGSAATQPEWTTRKDIRDSHRRFSSCFHGI